MFFLTLLYKIFGHNVRMVYFMQILLFSVSCILVFLITKEIFNERAAGYTAFFTAICPTLANYAIYLYSESFSVFILIFCIFSILKAKGTQLAKWYVISGLLLGFMVLCKAVMIFFIVPVMFYLYINKRTIKIILLFLMFILPVISWSLKNYFAFGSFRLADRGGMVLLIRAYKTGDSIEKMKETAVYAFSEYLGSRFFPDPAVESRDFLFQDDYRVHREYAALLKEGKGPAYADDFMRRKAILIIKQHPIKYLLQTPIEFLRLLSFMYLPSLNEKSAIDRFEKIRNGPVILSAIRGAYKLTAFLILFMSIAGICFRKIIWQKEFIVLAVILYVNLAYGLLYGYPRYSVPLIPFYFIFAVVGVMRICRQKIYE